MIEPNYDRPTEPREAQCKVMTKCPLCGEINSVMADTLGIIRWKAGALIQEALPDLNAEERELLITGICTVCWYKSFSEED